MLPSISFGLMENGYGDTGEWYWDWIHCSLHWNPEVQLLYIKYALLRWEWNPYHQIINFRRNKMQWNLWSNIKTHNPLRSLLDYISSPDGDLSPEQRRLHKIKCRAVVEIGADWFNSQIQRRQWFFHRLVCQTFQYGWEWKRERDRR